MSPVLLSALRRAAVTATLVLPAALLGGGCPLTHGGSCDGTGAAREDLAAQPVLSAAPDGAWEPANYRGAAVSTGCDDDSPGKAWLHADRVYAFTGTRQAVIEHYARTAAVQGWRDEPDPAPGGAPAAEEGACWTRTAHGRHLVLTVDFRLGGWSPAPDVGPGLAYEVSVGANADGSAEDAGCWS